MSPIVADACVTDQIETGHISASISQLFETHVLYLYIVVSFSSLSGVLAAYVTLQENDLKKCERQQNKE